MPDAPKVRLRRVQIRGLFGHYNHDFELSQRDRVTILHGPNGVGKTAVLRLLYALFSGQLLRLLSVRFDTFTVAFEGNACVTIERSQGAGSAEAERVWINVVDALGLQSRREARFENKITSVLQHVISRRAPWLTRLDDETWFDHRTDEKISVNELLLRLETGDTELRLDHTAVEELRPLVAVRALLQEVANRVDVHIIETQRLLTKGKKSDRNRYRTIDEGDEEVRTTVNECADVIKQRIGASVSNYASESQRRDQTFPMRLLALPSTTHVDRKGLKRRLDTIGKKRKQLADVGLLIDKSESYAESFERLDLESADDAQLRVIELYAGDTTGKLQTLDEVLQIASIFVDQVNSRFRHKRMMLDRQRGLIAVSDRGEAIKLDALSSGEQHQLVLFFDLLFRVNPGSLVLIDEPELSLHVLWQKTLLNSLIEIAATNGLDILIATHSPYIVADRMDLMRDLNSQGE